MVVQRHACGGDIGRPSRQAGRQTDRQTQEESVSREFPPDQRSLFCFVVVASSLFRSPVEFIAASPLGSNRFVHYVPVDYVYLESSGSPLC